MVFDVYREVGTIGTNSGMCEKAFIVLGDLALTLLKK
jgi:hypothetical protein